MLSLWAWTIFLSVPAVFLLVIIMFLKKYQMIPISDICKHYAVFYDDLGVLVGRKKISYRDETFSYKEKTYNFLPKESSYFKVAKPLRYEKHYFYNLNDPNPILLDKKHEPLMRSDVYKTVLDNDLVSQLNNLKKNKFLAWLMQPKVLITIAVVGVLLYFLLSGNDISALFSPSSPAPITDITNPSMPVNNATITMVTP